MKHPAKKLKNNEELQKLQNEEDSDEENHTKLLKMASHIAPGPGGLSKSTLCTMQISEMCTSENVQASREGQFEQMVQFLVHSEQRVKQLDLSGPQG